MKQLVSAILERGLSFITTPETWTQKVFSRDAKGLITPLGAHNAVSFCSDCALLKACNWNDSDTSPYWEAVAILQTTMGGGLISYNDKHTHTQVKDKWEKGIQLAKLKEAENAANK